VVLKTTSIAKQLFKSGAAPLYRSLVTSLVEGVQLSGADVSMLGGGGVGSRRWRVCT
jgi:hypothetical protein